MKKNKILIILGIFTFLFSCSSFSYLRKFEERRYRFCEDFETQEPIGKVCFRYCVDKKFWKPKECKRWATDILDITKKENFLKFREAGFILIDENRVN